VPRDVGDYRTGTENRLFGKSVTTPRPGSFPLHCTAIEGPVSPVAGHRKDLPPRGARNPPGMRVPSTRCKTRRREDLAFGLSRGTGGPLDGHGTESGGVTQRCSTHPEWPPTGPPPNRARWKETRDQVAVYVQRAFQLPM
jgi:hypothetical protein